MATNFNENSIVSSGGFKPSSKDTPLDIRTRVETEQDIYEIPNPYIGMIVYVKDTGKRFEILTLKEVDTGLTIKNVVDTYKQFTVDLEEYAKIEDVPTKVSELENDRGYATERFVDSKIETINNTVNSNTNTINSKINTINTEIDNINTDLIGVSESIEGSSVSVVSKDGYLKNVEILGNTIQNQNDLADIRSVGDKVEGQELYEIPVVSCGKNLNKSQEFGKGISQDGSYNSTGENNVTDYCIVKENTQYTVSINGVLRNVNQFYYDKDKKFISKSETPGSKFTTPQGAKYARFAFGFTQEGLIQLEEGTAATPYEPYQGDKLTILSPVQLEKVGNVADRIICKDGVWGVEKNINTIVFNGSENWRKNISSATHNRFTIDFISKGAMTDLICDQFPINGDTLTQSTVFIYNGSILIIGVSNDIVENDVNKFKAWLQTNPTTVLYQLPQPTFIPLPYDQQIKLRTFANKTNISFGCEIEPTLKASVPKSIGATVNSHSEQIDNLNKELDRVKKLEESTASTVTTESNFTTVTETSNGYFEDVKLEGRTLVNLRPINPIVVRDNCSYSNGKGIINVTNRSDVTIGSIQFDNSILRPNTAYTAIFEVSGDYNYKVGFDYGKNQGIVSELTSGKHIISFTTASNIDRSGTLSFWSTDIKQGQFIFENFIILEGDHTQNPPSYFEGLKSVGQDADDITMVTTNAPMFFGKGGKK